MTEEEIEKYRLTSMSNGWYRSQQGLIFMPGDYKRAYLSKVFKMNEQDDNTNKLILNKL
jgi:hypothetical protein